MQITINNDFQHGGQVFTQGQIDSFLQDEQTAVNILESTFTNNISVVFNVGFGSYSGALMPNQNISEADVNEAAVFFMNYSTLRQDLLTFGQPNFFTAANLPAGNSINGFTNFWVSSSVGAIFGLFTQAVDGFVGIGTGFTPGAQRVSAFLHELGHAMGRVPETIQGAASALDLWRFLTPGNRLFNGANPNNTPAYFSLDGGVTKLADWGETSDVSDFLNNNLTGNDPFNEFVGNLGHLTNLDLLITEALGFQHPTPNPPPPPGTTADMVLRHGADGLYEIYDIGGNAILAAFPLGKVGTDWRFVTLGGFFGNDTTDMLLRNANTGGFEVYDISNNQITGAAFLGNVGLDYQVMGFGNFSSFGETDMILRNVNNGALQVYDIRNNQIIGTNAMGAVGLDWQVAGFGNFSSRGTSDMVMRNVNSGGMVIYDINNNQVTSAYFIGAVGLDWQFAGVAPVSGAGASDLVLRNTNTGAFQVYNIAFNSLNGSASLGAVGLDWGLGGLAVDPPTGAGGAMGASDDSTSQLVQAMAGFGGGSGAADGMNSALGADALQQQQLLTSPQHA
jgi:hypothetical protein